MIKITDINMASVECYKAKDKDDLKNNLAKILAPESYLDFNKELVAVSEGKSKFSWESRNLTLTGEPIDVRLIWSAVPGYENDLSKVFVSIEDITERKQVEKKLRENEDRFRVLFEESPVPLWEEDFSAVKPHLEVLKAEGASDLYAYLKSHPDEVVNCASMIKILDVNKAALKLFGARNKKHLINNLAQIMRIEPSGKFIDELVDISNGVTRSNYETVNQAIGGRKIYINISWTTVPGYEKDLSRVLVSMVDITERKQMEIKLRESEESFRSLYENATIGIYRTTPDGKILMANQALVKMLGFGSFDELASRNLNNEGFESDPSRQEYQRRIEKEGEIHGQESVWRRKDGSTVYVRESARVVRDDKGKALYYDGTVEDISQRHIAEKALSDSESELQALFASMKDLVIVYNKDGRYLKIAATDAHHLIMPSKDLIGKTIHEDFPKERSRSLGKPHSKCIGNSKSKPY